MNLPVLNFQTDLKRPVWGHLPKRWMFLISVLSLLLSACDAPNSTNSPQNLRSFVANNQPQTQAPWVLAVHPYDVPTKVQLHFEPVLRFLSERLKHPVELYIATSYEDQIRQIATGKVHFAYLGPISFVTAHDKFSDAQGRRIQTIATEIPYQAALVVHKDSAIENIEQLRGHSVAFGSYFSYAGHFWSRHVMREHGVSLSDLQIYSFMGRHERAVLSVAYGDFDAAATTYGIARRLQQLNYPIRILYQSDDLAPIVFVAAPNVPQKLVEDLKQLLIHRDFDAQERITLFAPGGEYLAFDDQHYQRVRQILKTFEH